MSFKKGQKKSHRALDQWLDKLGYYRKGVARDDTCLFRAVSEQLYFTQIHHERIRADVVRFIRKNRNASDDKYAEKIEKHSMFCGDFELNVCSLLYERDVVIFDGTSMKKIETTNYGFDEKFLLCFLSPDHYDSVFKNEFIETAGFCQSVVYKILYENVFEIPEIDEIVDAMLYREENSMALELNNNVVKQCSNNIVCPPSSAQQLNVPFSFKIAKALDPNIYRNIEFDCWNEIRRELRFQQWYTGGYDFKVGVKCNVRFDEDLKICYIQKLSEEDNVCLVYLLEEACVATVLKSQLEPLPHALPWPIPSRNYKSKLVRKGFEEGRQKSLKPPRSPKNMIEIIKTTVTEKNVDVIPDNEIQNETIIKSLTAFESQSTDYECSIMPIYTSPEPESVNYIPPNNCLNFGNDFKVNWSAAPSVDYNGADLPLYDIPTLRFFFNKGIEFFNTVQQDQQPYFIPNIQIPVGSSPPSPPISPPLTWPTNLMPVQPPQIYPANDGSFAPIEQKPFININIRSTNKRRWTRKSQKNINLSPEVEQQGFFIPIFYPENLSEQNNAVPFIYRQWYQGQVPVNPMNTNVCSEQFLPVNPMNINGCGEQFLPVSPMNTNACSEQFQPVYIPQYPPPPVPLEYYQNIVLRQYPEPYDMNL